MNSIACCAPPEFSFASTWQREYIQRCERARPGRPLTNDRLNRSWELALAREVQARRVLPQSRRRGDARVGTDTLTADFFGENLYSRARPPQMDRPIRDSGVSRGRVEWLLQNLIVAAKVS
jgi:hypothetical protein